jgi:ABC-type transport system involved in multi-copper enzyme maturation permease subunit
MSTATVTTPRHAPQRAVAGAPAKVTQARVFTSEWIKLRSLRSTVYTLLAAIVMTVGLGMLFSGVIANRWSQLDAAERVRFDPTGVSLRGVFLAQLAIGVLGVLLITGEYSTGMIRATLSAVPKRLPVLWAKAGLFAVVAAITMIPAALVAFLGGQALLGTHGTTLGASEVARSVIGAGLYLTVVGLLGIGLGFIIRNTAGAIATLFGVLLVLPVLGAVLPSSWAKHIVPYLPSNAGQAVMSVHQAPGDLAPWTGFAVFCGYAAAAIIVSAVLLKRRDA